MAEHLSGYQPESRHQDGLSVGSDIDGLEGAYSLLDPDELEQMRQSAAAIEADMKTPQAPFVPAPPDELIPISCVEADDETKSPVWGIESLDEQLFPEEAPTQKQREHARDYYFNLVALTEKRYRSDRTFPEPQELIEAYAAYQEIVEVENQGLPPGERLPSFTLTQLWAAVRRQNLWIMRWLQDQRAYKAPEEYEEALFILLNIKNGVAEAVRQINL